MHFLNDIQTILNAAEAYFHLGYAVIPLLGDLDPDRPKVAACSWLPYQHRRPTLDEIAGWFIPTGNAAALGIVTGRISRLIVLDFDSQAAFTDFRQRYPDLIETRTVHSASRGLPHLYFHLPSHLSLASQKAPGVDLLSDGRYVVAPPTIINQQPYRLVRGGMPRTLNAHDLSRLQSFMATYKTSTSAPHHPTQSALPAVVLTGAGGVQRGFTPPSPAPSLLADTLTETSGMRSKIMTHDLHALYHYWLTRGGRNDALFRTALHARDHGWDETRTRRALSALHVGRSTSQPEPAHIRQREAHATIRSAFSRPARPQKRLHQPNTIPNSVREALMQRRQTYIIRTLEGLMQAGFRAGQVFTADQALHALKGLVGRDSIYNALNALAPNGKPFFAQIPPSALPQASKEAAQGTKRLKTKKCFFVTEKKSGIKKRGPKNRRFRLPANRDLCQLLGVKRSGSDPLTRNDLISARQTRMALHRELIKRRPANYSRRWLAARIGVSRRTLDTYNRLIPIHSRPVYETTLLSWANIEHLLTDEALAGAFIETLTGKRYPALRSIAAHLLAKGTFIRLQTRVASYYWYGDEPPAAANPALSPPTVAPKPARMLSAAPPVFERTIELPVSATAPPEVHLQQPVLRPDEASIALVRQSLRPARILPVPPKRFRHPLPDAQEALAQRLYTTINQRVPQTARQLSLNNARRLAFTYTEKQITQALTRLQHRTTLANPTGFFVTVLRSSASQEIK